ncbi:hypothetical protein WICPIJ_001725 [Wickerhamomyces pijperi]|uniref:Small ribosomal subunit protein uS9m n=1 Tax=Wickerhamomyces pijperi TaxID=599730 RepID=A0A9P8QAA8_WICPI|nr:hypothetical protein WICPIJ_001725 [Wickerhamomyces pijperi]
MFRVPQVRLLTNASSRLSGIKTLGSLTAQLQSLRLQSTSATIPEQDSTARTTKSIARRDAANATPFIPELEAKRIVPTHSTYYTPNADHERNLTELQSLHRKYIHLPTTPLKEGKWLNMQQYEPIGGGERLKPSQHKALVSILNKLGAIEPQLMPVEVSDVLIRYSRSSTINEKSEDVKQLDQYGRSRTVGGRKSSHAVVYLVEGTGEFLVNGKSLNAVFPELKHRAEILFPFKVIESESKYNMFAIVQGGGVTGQAGAIANAIGKGLVVHNPLLKGRLYKAGCMTRDHRHVERKKPGKVKARKSPTWVKR